MKDGVNSANRYYLNRFRDAYRQAVIGKNTISTKLNNGIWKSILKSSWLYPSDGFFFFLRPKRTLSAYKAHVYVVDTVCNSHSPFGN